LRQTNAHSSARSQSFVIVKMVAFWTLLPSKLARRSRNSSTVIAGARKPMLVKLRPTAAAAAGRKYEWKIEPAL
jgi:hypothetical protein